MEYSYLKNKASLRYELEKYEIDLMELIEMRSDHIEMMDEDENAKINFMCIYTLKKLDNKIELLEIKMKGLRIEIEELDRNLITYKHDENQRRIRTKYNKDKLKKMEEGHNITPI
jgi:type II secretory pathway predicted ATPase ExeA